MSSTSPPAPESQREQLLRLKEVQLRQLQFRRRSLGEDHVGSVESMERLAETLVALEDFPRAIALREAALRVRAEVVGPRRPETVETAWSLYHVLDHVGDGEAARGVFRDHLAWLLTATEDELEPRLLRVREWVQLLPEEVRRSSEA